MQDDGFLKKMNVILVMAYGSLVSFKVAEDLFGFLPDQTSVCLRSVRSTNFIEFC